MYVEGGLAGDAGSGGGFQFSSTAGGGGAVSRTSFSLNLVDALLHKRQLISIQSFIGGLSGKTSLTGEFSKYIWFVIWFFPRKVFTNSAKEKKLSYVQHSGVALTLPYRDTKRHTGRHKVTVKQTPTGLKKSGEGRE